MNIAIDYGNSLTKVGIFDKDELTEKLVFPRGEGLKKFLREASADQVIIGSVMLSPAEMDALVPAGKKILVLSHTTSLPITLDYKTPHTLGVDRIAGVCGAQQFFPNRNCLVIDAGSCITYDFIDRDATYHGGAISPGMNMRFSALNKFTARLPLVAPATEPEWTGSSTEGSIQSGVVNGILAEMGGFMDYYKNKYPDTAFILCGGDTSFFENKLKPSIFACPDLVLYGLNGILRHNVR